MCSDLEIISFYIELFSVPLNAICAKYKVSKFGSKIISQPNQKSKLIVPIGTPYRNAAMCMFYLEYEIDLVVCCV